MSNTIIAIVGEAGVGKDYIASFLADHTIWNRIVSYTTRHMREGEKQGREHLFVDTYPESEDIVCHTEYGGSHYWVTAAQIQAYHVSIYVVDEYGLKMLRENNRGAWNIISILVLRDRELRLKAGVSEERMQRDKDRTTLPQDSYDIVIKNNKSIKALDHKLRELINHLQAKI